MRKDILAAAFLIVMIAVIAVAGCTRNPAAPSTPPPAVTPSTETPSKANAVENILRAVGSAPASAQVGAALGTLYTYGIYLMIAGGVLAIIGMKNAGYGFGGLGFLMIATGVLFMDYPWVVLILGGLYLLVFIDRWWTSRKMKTTDQELALNHEVIKVIAEKIQNRPEGPAFKAAFKAMGFEVVEKMNAVIDPVKQELKAEGKI